MTSRDLKVTQRRSRNLFRENFLLGLFHSKKILVSMEDLSLFFTLKHKHLVIWFTVKGIRIKAFDDCRLSYYTNKDRSLVASLARAPTFRRSSAWRGFQPIDPNEDVLFLLYIVCDSVRTESCKKGF